MKKQSLTAKMAAALLCLTVFMTGCGGNESNETAAIYDYDLTEYITLGQYSGIEAPAFSVEVTDEEVQAEIEARLHQAGEAAADYEDLTEGVVQAWDVTNIDYAGSKDGELFEGGSAEAFELTIGSGEFIPGFEDGLIGKSIGETTVVELTFPEYYPNSPDLAGQPVEFEVTINSVRRVRPAELNEEFILANSASTTVEEYTASVKAELEEAGRVNAQSERENYLWQTVVSNCTIIGYPEKELNETLEAITGQFTSYAAAASMEFSDYLTQLGMTQEQFDESALTGSQTQTSQEMIMCAIARQEGIEITAEEYEAEKLSYLNMSGYESEEAFEEAAGDSFEAVGGRKYIEMTLLNEKVMEFIVANSVEV